jgi:hypothetical protein
MTTDGPRPDLLVRRALPLLLLVLVGVVAAIAVVAALRTWTTDGASRSYSLFLSDVSEGRVRSVVQQGSTLTVDEFGEHYDVTVPTVLTPVYQDMLDAAARADRALPADVYTAREAPDTSWLGVLVTGLLPLAVILGFLLVAGRWLRIARPSVDTLRSRLAQLDEAREAGLISADEYATKRAEILARH